MSNSQNDDFNDIDNIQNIVSDYIPPIENKSKTKSTSNKKKVVQFKPDELKMFDDVTKELGMDTKTHSDLMTSLPDIQDPTQEEIIDLINDKNVKTTVIEDGKSPPISNILDEGDQIGSITDDEIKKIKEQNDKERSNMVMLLGTKDSMNLDIKIGMRDGKSVYVQKKYYFNSISKREEMQLGMLRARLNQINTEYQVLARKSYDDYDDEQATFVSLAPAMIEIGSYKLSEFEAKLRLGMPADDFARVEVIQYGFALQVIGWRTLNPRFSKQGR